MLPLGSWQYHGLQSLLDYIDPTVGWYKLARARSYLNYGKPQTCSRSWSTWRSRPGTPPGPRALVRRQILSDSWESDRGGSDVCTWVPGLDIIVISWEHGLVLRDNCEYGGARGGVTGSKLAGVRYISLDNIDQYWGWSFSIQFFTSSISTSTYNGVAIFSFDPASQAPHPPRQIKSFDASSILL